MRRFVPILIAGLALIATACGDAIAPTRSDDASLTRVGGPLSAAKNGYVGPHATYVNVTIPAKGGVVTVGNFAVTFPANAVCNPKNSGYGPGTWDDPCHSLKKDYSLRAAYWVENGEPFVEFLADLRFNPEKTVILSVFVAGLKGSTGSQEILYWSRTGNSTTRVYEGSTDSSLQSEFDSESGTLRRRIKHFSGYLVASGRCDTASDPNCSGEPQ